MHVLNDLLRIKKFREDKAEMALARAKASLHESEMHLEKSKLTLQNFVIEAKRKEQALFSDLLIRLVKLKDIDSVALDMSLIKEETVKLEENLAKAKDARQLAQDASDEAKIIHLEAVRMREKFSELVNISHEEILFESQRLEDLELEEAGSSRHSRLIVAENEINSI